MIGADRLQTRAPGYVSRVAPGELDVQRARDLLARERYAEAGGPNRRGAERGAWLDEVGREHDNLRAALAGANRETGCGWLLRWRRTGSRVGCSTRASARSRRSSPGPASRASGGHEVPLERRGSSRR